MKRYNFHLTEAQIKGLRDKSATTGMPVAEIIRRLINAHLKYPLPQKAKKK
jgi:hypothetical protein